MTEAKMDRQNIGPAAVKPADKARAAILDAALPNVVFDGWSELLLRNAAREAGITQRMARLVLPGGAADLAAYFHRRGDSEMLDRLSAAGIETLKIREKIALGVRTRLEVAEPNIEAVQRAASMYALPTHGAQGARLLWETADHIWNAAGDSAEDYNWYTKRLTLSGVFSATLLFWLNDDTPGKDATWRFLDRRIEGVTLFEKTKARVQGHPLGKLALSGPMALLSRIRAPQSDARPSGLGVGFPGRRQKG